MVEWRVTVTGLDEAISALWMFPDEVDKGLFTVMSEGERLGLQTMRQLAPTRSGFLVSRMYSYMPDRFTVGLVSGAPYSLFVEEATKAHWIPKGGVPGPKMLRFRGTKGKWAGKWVFQRVIWHPGTRAQPFIRPAARRVLEYVPRRFMELMKAFLRAVGF